MILETLRHKLPLLAVGQAQKEYTHNEALLLIDNLLSPSIVSVLDSPDTIGPESIEGLDIMPDNSKAWLISDMPNGIWSQRANQIAILNENGFRYIEPLTGMHVYNEQSECIMMYKDMSWHIAPILSEPNGGSVIDAQARESIAAILHNLRQFGLSRL